MNSNSAIVSLLFLVFSSGILAQKDTTRLREVEVVDSIPELRSALGSSYSKKQIKEVHGIQVGDILKEFPGVYIRDYGGLGGLKTISLRSLGASHTQVVVDGVPQFNGLNGTVNVGNIPTENLNDVALYYHTRTGLVPASAYAGAGNVFLSTEASKFSENDEIGSGSVSCGSFGQWIGNLSGRIQKNQRFTLFGHLRLDQLEGDFPYQLENGAAIIDNTRQNSQLQSLNALVGGIIKTSSNSQLSWRSQYYNSERGLPGAVVFYAPNFRQRMDQENLNFQLQFQQQLEKWSYKILGNYQNNKLNYFDPDYLNTSGELQQSYPLQNAFLSFTSRGRLNHLFSWKFATDGLQEGMEKYSQKTIVREARRFRQFSLSGLYFHGFNWDAEISLHQQYWNTNNQNEVAFNPQVHLSHTFPLKKDKHHLTTRSFYKRNLRLPTFSELFYNVIEPLELEPEIVDQFDIGLSYFVWLNNNTQFLIKSDVYFYDVKNMIFARPTQNLFIWSVSNLGRVKTLGNDTELFLKYEHQNWQVSGTLQYGYQLAQNVTSESDSYYEHQIPYTPAHQFHSNLSAQYRNTSFRLSAQWIGARYYLNENLPQFSLEPYFVGDATLSHEFNWERQELELSFQVRNFLNQQYQIIRSFPMPGIQFIGKISYRLKKKS